MKNGIEQLYQQALLDHYKNPRNYGELKNPDFVSGKYNPSCGDRVDIQAKVQDGILIDVAFTGTGCVISLAAASLLLELVKGKLLTEIQALTADDIKKLIGISLGPVRLKCALLPLYALQEGITSYLAGDA